MITFKIDSADIILNDLGGGQGKIIIADTSWGYNFSYFWGAMGMDLIDFLIKINAGYFTGKLGPTAQGDINVRKTMASVRKGLKEYFYSEYPWYVEKEFQSELRYQLKEMEDEGFESVDHFISSINRFSDDLNYYLINDRHDRERIKKLIKDSLNEPWYFIVHDEHRQNIYLTKLHKKLVKVLKKLKKDKIKTELIKSF